MRQFKIGNYTIKDDDFFVIAEIGNNHNGSVDLCCKMMKKAVECGAHAVKLQKRNIDTFWSEEILNKPYDNENSFGKTYREHKYALEFDKKQWEKVVKFCKKHKILLFCTAFDEESVDFLENFDLPAYKVASAGHTDTLLIDKLISTNKPLIISVGGGNWTELNLLDDQLTLSDVPTDRYCYLHCTAEYPPEAQHMNMRVIPRMLEQYPETQIGFSDHYIHSGDQGVMAYLAYALGARIFERHFTFNRAWKGPDHKLSMEPDQFTAMRHSLDRLKVALGDGFKVCYAEEVPNVAKMKKWRG